LEALDRMAKPNVSRRLFVGMLGSSVLAAPALRDAAASPSPAAGAAEQLLHPLRPGSRLARWTLVSIEPFARGALGLVLEAERDHLFRLEILARDRSPIGARPRAETEHFAIFVENGGDGWSPTIEEQGIAAMAVATLIRRNEAPRLSASFLTHSERIARHPGALLSPTQ
jgi:hypothetical protein